MTSITQISTTLAGANAISAAIAIVDNNVPGAKTLIDQAEAALEGVKGAETLREMGTAQLEQTVTGATSQLEEGNRILKETMQRLGIGGNIDMSAVLVYVALTGYLIQMYQG